VVLREKPGEGEQCLVCGQAIYDYDVVQMRHKGRTFWVAAPMLADLASDPETYFRKLEPRSALFDEMAIRERPMTRGWLWLGLYVLAGLVCGGLAAYSAVGRALPPRRWFFAGLAGNVLALAALATRPAGDASRLPAGVPRGLAKVATTRSPVTCPVCGAGNHPAAAACSTCGAVLAPAVEAETARA
jgi:hypothetical protein